MAFLLTALVFMLVGLSISLPQLGAVLPWVACGIAGTLVGRTLVVYSLLGGAWRIGSSRSTARRARAGWRNVLFTLLVPGHDHRAAGPAVDAAGDRTGMARDPCT